MFVIGDASVEDRNHVDECAQCQAQIARLAVPLAQFGGAVRDWSERAAEPRWTVIPAADHLDRLLLPAALDVPWYRSLASGVREFFQPAPPPLDLTSKPILVREIWGQFGRQKRSWAMSLALQSAAVVLVLATAAVTPSVREHVKDFVLMVPTDVAPPQVQRAQGGGGGGDRSPLPPSRGRAAKFEPRQFVPPAAVIANNDPKLTMDPTLIGPPDVRLPTVNMDQFGDPLAKIGPPSNGPGSGGGIGTGKGGGIGPGKGPGYGQGEGGGIGDSVYRLGGGVSAPGVISKVEPEYSEDARKAKYQGVVVLYVEIDPAGRARNMRVMNSLGLGLDEKAMEAVSKWKFRPGMKDGRPVTVAATIEVHFRLL